MVGFWVKPRIRGVRRCNLPLLIHCRCGLGHGNRKDEFSAPNRELNRPSDLHVVGQITGITSASRVFRGPHRGTGRGLFRSVCFQSDVGLPPHFPCAAAFSWSCVSRWAQGNCDEQTARCRTDRSIVYFVRGTSSGAGRKCRSWRGVGGRRPWTGRRSGRCIHRIYRRTGDRAFLGSGALRIAITGATCRAIHSGNAATGGRSGEFAAASQDDRPASGKERRAAGSGI